MSLEQSRTSRTCPFFFPPCLRGCRTGWSKVNRSSRSVHSSIAIARRSSAMVLPCLAGSAAGHAVRHKSVQLSCASFSTTSIIEAQKKVAKKPAAQKRKTPIKKTSGSKGPKTPKRGGGGDSGLLVSASNEFLMPRPNMSDLKYLRPFRATPENVNKPMKWSGRFQGSSVTREMERAANAEPQPRTMLRQVSLDLFTILEQSGAASGSSSSSSSSNVLLQGPRGAGISTLLAQSVSYALDSHWIVLYIPRMINTVDSSSPYVYSKALNTYLQPELATKLLKKVRNIGAPFLDRLTIGEDVLLEGGSEIKAGTSLQQAIRVGLQDKVVTRAVQQVITQQILEAVLKTIVQQTEFPVLLAIDGAQGLFSTSCYRDPDFRKLQSYELAIPRLLHACLRRTGPGSFGGIQRGRALMAFSTQHNEWPIPAELKTVVQPETASAYARLDEIMMGLVEECRLSLMEITPSLTIDEATSLFDLVRKEGRTWLPASDEHLMKKLAESGGNIGVFFRSLHTSVV